MGSPLLAASKRGDTATVLALIHASAGALVDATEDIRDTWAPAWSSLWTPMISQSVLVAAAKMGHTEVVTALIKAGAKDWRLSGLAPAGCR